ncbi:MAG: hypothetical protein AAB436_03395 [Patescibacteria group bacterium]
MTTTQEVLIIVLTVLLSIFIIICTAFVVGLVQLLSSVKRVAAKAEDVIDSVESAAEVLKDTQGRLAFFKLVGNIMKLTQKGKKK